MENEQKMNKNDLIEELLTRGVEKIYPNKEFLQSKLQSGEKLSIYYGIDPTGPSLHFGHTVQLFKLAELQKLGHRIILLIGDFTGMIGDPTDKMAARVLLTREQVLQNAKSYKKQASTILSFGGENPAELKYNSKWLNKLSMNEVSRLLSYVTYAQTIKRDMFQKRIAEGKDLYVNEFLYPVLQGYDSVAMDVDGEVGGNDQTFNMLMGRDLLKRIKGKEKFVLSTKLLVDSEGKKMGKTEGNMVSLDEKPEEMLGKIMSWSDSIIIPAMELCTNLPMSKIAEAKIELEKGKNPRDLKLDLAEAVVSIYHGEKKAKKAREGFISAFSKGGIPENIQEVKVEVGSELVESVLKAGLIKSKTEWRRLVEEGAVSIIGEGDVATKVSDFNFKVSESSVFKIGKHRFLKVVL